MRIRLLLPIAAVALAFAAPAQADDNSNFLIDIKNAGINFSDSSTTVTAGRTVCRMLEAGSSEGEIIGNLQGQNPGFSPAKAQTFESTAVSDLCPDDAPGTDDQPAGADLGGGGPNAASGDQPNNGSATHNGSSTH